MTSYYLPLEPGAFYHIYNCGNNGDNLFYKTENYRYFLQKLNEFAGSSIDVYAYALLPNHFHLLVKTKSDAGLQRPLRHEPIRQKPLDGYATVVSEAFRRFFLSYSNSIKKQEGRTGSLLEKNFKRILLQSDKHLLWLVNYIHRNPQTHGLVSDFRYWAWTSYASILSEAPSKLCREEVLALFGGKEEFMRFHLTNPVSKELDLRLE